MGLMVLWELCVRLLVPVWVFLKWLKYAEKIKESTRRDGHQPGNDRKREGEIRKEGRGIKQEEETQRRKRSHSCCASVCTHFRTFIQRVSECVCVCPCIKRSYLHARSRVCVCLRVSVQETETDGV